jgi:sarcosine oxidase subunit alpha
MSRATQRRGSRLRGGELLFTFDGVRYPAVPGDTAASALLANGVRLFARSVKYRRARGLIAAGPEEPNALLTAGRAPAIVPNVPAPQLVLADGMELSSQNRWPSLRFDLTALLRLGGGMLGAGFYYKTFIWPSWRSYEGIIRSLAGLGAAPGACALKPPRVEHLRCEVLVAGAGAAGLAAARAAMRAGAGVVLCEREPVCGGELEFEAAHIEGLPAQEWVRTVLAELEAGGARVLTETTVIGGSSDAIVAHREPDGLADDATAFYIHPQAMISAMGSVERPIAFIDNDLPGVMLLGAAERYAARYGVRVGERVVLFGNHDRLYAAARRLIECGIAVAAIVDTRPQGSGPAHRDLIDAGVECLAGHALIRAEGSPGVRAARIAPLASSADARTIRCDAILVSGGWTPAVHAGLHEGGSRTYAAESAAFIATHPPARRASCGAANGVLELGAVLADAHAAGLAAATGLAAAAGGGAHAAAGSAASAPAPVGHGDGAPRLAPFWRAPATRAEQKRQFVDLQNDVTVADIRQALAEGFQDIEHVKRYTTLGVGTEQGRTGGTLGAAILAELSGRELQTVGTSRTRAPFAPATLATLCGDRRGLALRPERRTPLHDWHADHGGEFESMGLWLRPRFYRRSGAHAASAGIAEAARVRRSGGIVDASTLGKIEVAGADAAAFLDRIYLTRASTIKVGRSKYMVLLREDGMVLDDGIVLRLAADRYLATVSSSHADHLHSHFEFWRDLEFADRRVALADVTEAWAVIAVAGPQSRSALCTVLGAEHSDVVQRLTHMEFADCRWAGGTLRVLRASFSGELAYELHCQPAAALPLWQALHAAGLAPYGLEALDILRVEKGYLTGSELNGQTTPQDLGMDSLLKLGNPCVGRELLSRPGLSEPSRPRLVGLRSLDQKSSFLGGAQLTLPTEDRYPCGYVTSAAYSPALQQWVALGLVARSVAHGAQLIARDPLRGQQTRVQVSTAVHVDPDGSRMKS